MSLALINTPAFSYREACEFFDHKENEIKFQQKITQFEQAITQHCKENNNEKLNRQITGETEGAVTHNFADGQYIRTIVMPKNVLISTKIHVKNHPFFIMTGEVSIFNEQGVQHIKAPFQGITEVGTKRVLYVHEECTFITVHRTDCLDVDEILNEVTVKDFSKLPLKGFDINQIDGLIEKLGESS
tara:strand:- start:626 stop:1183 length:558 start_codon:yes stop_codon:yes gene_type:complete